jgi:hypothetical protein
LSSISRSVGALGGRVAAVAAAAALAAIPLVHSAPALAAAPAPAPAGVRGTPWTGPMGVSEGVAQVMSRHASSALPRAVAPVRPAPARQSSPAAALASSSAAQAHDAVLPRPLVSAASSFLGASLATAGSIPPDSMGAAGPTQFLVGVNGLIKTFDKSTGTADGVLSTTTDAFFGPVLGAGLVTSDPRVRYDRLSGRWFVTMVSVDPAAGNLQPANSLLLAVSSGGTITPTSTFTLFAFKQDSVTPAGNDAGCFLDFDTLGLDVNALYVGGNFFCSNGTTAPYQDSSELVIRKASVLGSGPIVVTAFRNLTNGTAAGPFAPQGADNDDPSATVGYLIGIDVHQFSHLVLRRIASPGGTPSISANIDLPVAATTAPITVPHLGSDGRNLDGIDDRLVNAVVRNGTIWTAHNIQVDSSGVASTAGGRNGSRWYQVQGLDATPAVAQFGTVFDAGGGSQPASFWLPSVNVSAQGHMAMGGSMAGAGHFADAWVAGRLSRDSAGFTGPPVLYTSSSAAYNPVFQGFADNPHRWGDFSFTSLDPNDGMTMWTAQEYTDSGNSWGVRVAKLLAPPPTLPVTAIPASVPVGLSSVDVAIVGGAPGDAGFFDPGPGFAKRIGAAVGGGTVVKSVRYDNPGQVVLNLDTTHAAEAPASVTITNPDGQSATGTVLNITPAAGQLRATTNPALPSQLIVDGNPADSWGLNWLNLPAGSHTVAYTHVEGFTEPAPQTVTVTAGAITTLTGSFTQRGSLRVITSPAVPAAITVDGVARDDWGMWTDLPTGSHQVCFGRTANFTPPPCQTATVAAGALTQITGTFTSSPGAPGPSGTGQLRVTTSPALPSQVLVNGVPMDSWGLNWVDLAPGSYTVAFTHVEGFTEPAPQTVTVTAGAITTIAGSFTQRGSLRVVTSPATPGTITVDGIPRDNWGMWTDLPTGQHRVCFGWAPSSVAPPCPQPAFVIAGSLTTITGTYTPGPA